MVRQILIVDDDPVLRKMLQVYLERDGLAVATAANGKEGLRVFRELRPQIIILDYRMPEMDGLAFLKALRSEGVTSYSVIMLAGNNDETLIQDCYRLGIHAFVIKPPHPLVLKGMIMRAFELLQYSSELRQQIRAREQAFDLLQTTFDSIPEGVLTLDSKLRVRMISARACDILEMTREMAVGLSVDKIVGEAFSAPASPLMRCIRESIRLTNIQTQIVNPAGKTIPVALTVNAAADESNRRGWILLFRDLRKEEHGMLARGKFVRFGKMISADPKMKELFDLIEKVAPTHATVLIEGESGTGKELVAWEIHDRSGRGHKPFHAVNCAAIPPQLLESEFFGHEKGSFTGADQRKPGRLELADGGTLFLDEIGEMPLELQGKLLRVLQEKKFERVGGSKTIEVDIRVVAATNRDLKKMAAELRFREDLYYRLRVIPIQLPPLRERILDIPHLVRYMVALIQKREKAAEKFVSSDVLQRLMDHHWPGNIRELINVVEYAFVVCSDNAIRLEHLPKELQQVSSRSSSTRIKTSPAGSEKEFLLRTLESVNFHKGKAAEKLGINPSTLYRKMKKYGI